MDAVRSLLFVPGDNERRIVKAQTTVADALILDLEDSVAPERKATARDLCREVLLRGLSKRCFVRINALSTSDALVDLASVMKGRPYGVMLPKCDGAKDVRTLDNYLSALEAREGIPLGSTRVLGIATETASALFGIQTYQPGAPRLCGLLWGGEDLAADIGARANRREDGRYAPPYELARSLCLLGAAAARVTAVDAVYTEIKNTQGLRAETELAARDGFGAKAAIHPDQLEIINEVFTPTAEENAYAQRVVALFESDESKGVVSLDGSMLDRPHLLMAKRTLARAR